MKTALYVATVARTYRKAIDDYLESPEKYRKNLEWYKEEIGKCTYREFTTGFYFGKPQADAQIYDNNTYVRNYVYLGTAEAEDENGLTVLTQKNKFVKGDTVEIMKPDGRNLKTTVLRILDSAGQEMEEASHASQELHVLFSEKPEIYDILRVSAEESHKKD